MAMDDHGAEENLSENLTVNPIIEALQPGISSLLCLQIEYYHTSDDEDLMDNHGANANLSENLTVNPTLEVLQPGISSLLCLQIEYHHTSDDEDLMDNHAANENLSEKLTVNPILEAEISSFVCLQIIEYYHTSDDDDEEVMEELVDVEGEVLGIDLSDDENGIQEKIDFEDLVNPIIRSFQPGISSLVCLQIEYYHTSDDEEEVVEGLTGELGISEDLVNPIIRAFQPGISSLVCLQIEYYHTSDDEEEVVEGLTGELGTDAEHGRLKELQENIAIFDLINPIIHEYQPGITSEESEDEAEGIMDDYRLVVHGGSEKFTAEVLLNENKHGRLEELQENIAILDLMNPIIHEYQPGITSEESEDEAEGIMDDSGLVVHGGPEKFTAEVLLNENKGKQENEVDEFSL